MYQQNQPYYLMDPAQVLVPQGVDVHNGMQQNLPMICWHLVNIVQKNPSANYYRQFMVTVVSDNQYQNPAFKELVTMTTWATHISMMGNPNQNLEACVSSVAMNVVKMFIGHTAQMYSDQLQQPDASFNANLNNAVAEYSRLKNTVNTFINNGCRLVPQQQRPQPYGRGFNQNRGSQQQYNYDTQTPVSSMYYSEQPQNTQQDDRIGMNGINSGWGYGAVAQNEQPPKRQYEQQIGMNANNQNWGGAANERPQQWGGNVGYTSQQSSNVNANGVPEWVRVSNRPTNNSNNVTNGYPNQHAAPVAQPQRSTNQARGVMESVDLAPGKSANECQVRSHNYTTDADVWEVVDASEWKASPEQPWRTLYNKLRRKPVYKRNRKTGIVLEYFEDVSMEELQHRLPGQDIRALLEEDAKFEREMLESLDKMKPVAVEPTTSDVENTSNPTTDEDSTTAKDDTTKMPVVEAGNITSAFNIGNLLRITDAGCWDFPRSFVFNSVVSDTYYTKLDNSKYILDILDSTTWRMAAATLSSLKDRMDPMTFNRVDKDLADLVNCTLAVNCGLGDAVEIESFYGDLEDLYAYLSNEQSEVIYELFNASASALLGRLYSIKPSKEKEVKGDTEANETEAITVARAPYSELKLAQNNMMALVDSNEAALNLEELQSGAVVKLQPNEHKVMFKLAIQLSHAAAKSKARNVLVMTSNGNIYEILQGFLAKDCYLIRKFK